MDRMTATFRLRVNSNNYAVIECGRCGAHVLIGAAPGKMAQERTVSEISVILANHASQCWRDIIRGRIRSRMNGE